MGVTIDILRDEVNNILKFVIDNDVCVGFPKVTRLKFFHKYCNELNGMQILFDSAYFDDEDILNEVNNIIGEGKMALAEYFQILD